MYGESLQMAGLGIEMEVAARRMTNGHGLISRGNCHNPRPREARWFHVSCSPRRLDFRVVCATEAFNRKLASLLGAHLGRKAFPAAQDDCPPAGVVEYCMRCGELPIGYLSSTKKRKRKGGGLCVSVCVEKEGKSTWLLALFYLAVLIEAS